MARLVLGGVVGGIVIWLVGFLFWGSPLGQIPFSVASDADNAALQAAMAQHLGPTGSGAYMVPWPMTPQGTALYGQGPIAMVMFQNSGSPVMDSAGVIAGLILGIICALVIAFALRGIAGRVTEFGDRARVAVLMAVSITAYTDLGPILFMHGPVFYHVYLWISDAVALALAGVVIARWFLPKAPGAV